MDNRTVFTLTLRANWSGRIGVANRGGDIRVTYSAVGDKVDGGWGHGSIQKLISLGGEKSWWYGGDLKFCMRYSVREKYRDGFGLRLNAR